MQQQYNNYSGIFCENKIETYSRYVNSNEPISNMCVPMAWKKNVRSCILRVLLLSANLSTREDWREEWRDIFWMGRVFWPIPNFCCTEPAFPVCCIHFHLFISFSILYEYSLRVCTRECEERNVLFKRKISILFTRLYDDNNKIIHTICTDRPYKIHGMDACENCVWANESSFIQANKTSGKRGQPTPRHPVFGQAQADRWTMCPRGTARSNGSWVRRRIYFTAFVMPVRSNRWIACVHTGITNVMPSSRRNWSCSGRPQRPVRLFCTTGSTHVIWFFGVYARAAHKLLFDDKFYILCVQMCQHSPNSHIKWAALA